MKAKIIGSSFLLSFTIIILSSYKTGPAHGGLGNRTGSSGSSNSCSMGCHGAESSTLLLSFTLKDIATGAVVTDGQYEPGHEYEVTLSGTYSGTAAYTHLGFQASVVNGAGSNSGTITAADFTTATIGVGGLTLIEHINPILKTGSSYEAIFLWTAPPTGSGSADFYARMVVNNNNNTPSDDTPNKIKATFTEKMVSSLEAPGFEPVWKLYPNPANDDLNISVDDNRKATCCFVMRDIYARELLRRYYNNTGSGINFRLDISGLAPGTYFMELANGSGHYTTAFIKQ